MVSVCPPGSKVGPVIVNLVFSPIPPVNYSLRETSEQRGGDEEKGMEGKFALFKAYCLRFKNNFMK